MKIINYILLVASLFAVTAVEAIRITCENNKTITIPKGEYEESWDFYTKQCMEKYDVGYKSTSFIDEELDIYPSRYVSRKPTVSFARETTPRIEAAT